MDDDESRVVQLPDDALAQTAEADDTTAFDI
jgi:hypothetical protein